MAATLHPAPGAGIRLLTTYTATYHVADADLPDRGAVHRAEDAAVEATGRAALDAGHIVLDDDPRHLWQQVGPPDPATGRRPVTRLTTPYALLLGGASRRPSSGWWALVVLVKVAAAPGAGLP